MTLLDLAFLLAAGFLAVQGLVALVNAGTFPRLRPVPGTPEARPRVSLLVPVRDEAATLPETLPALLAQGADEVLVLDDRSQDGSRALLEAAAAATPALRVLDGAELPPGWTGKNWACHQLAQAATGEVWIFTDADVHWRAGALDALLAAWPRGEHAFASVWPRQRTVGWLERIAVPQVDMILIGGLPWPLVPRLPFPSLAAGNGQLMAWTPSAYRAAGGHAAVRDVVLEDVRMAQRAKAAGVTPFLALGDRMVETRMYRSATEVLDGFAKNVLPAAGSWPALTMLVGLNALAYLAAWPLALVEARWLVVALAGVALRGGVAAVVGRSPLEAALQPAAPLALVAIVARVVVRRGGYVWRGRRYARGRS